jgi:hypothetical protein
MKPNLRKNIIGTRREFYFGMLTSTNLHLIFLFVTKANKHQRIPPVILCTTLRSGIVSILFLALIEVNASRRRVSFTSSSQIVPLGC